MLGEGSFGKVFKAMHHDRNEVVAVKVVSLEDDNGQLENEIELLKACKHSGIVQYFSSFVHQSKLWIVMEYCEGSSLLDVMSACGRCLTEPQTAAAVAACTHALQYLHEQRLVHRDIKAGNLLLDSDGIVKLADFGVAAIVGLTIAARRTVIGTPFWMAPEVITCQRSNPDGYDMLADVWSLGITAIEIAEGQPPHAQVSPLTAIFLIPTLPAPSLKEPASWSPEFVAMLKRCLVKNPAQRASSADLMSDPFIRHGHEAAARGVMRALMSAARDPLRAFRDKEERRARHAAEGRQRRKSAEDMRNPGAGAAAPLGAANTQYSSATLPRPKSGSGSGGGSGADVQRSSGSGGGARDDFDLAAISAIAKKFAEDLIRPSTAPGWELARTMPGVTGPFGFFDPLNICPEDEMDVKLWREAELMHCRVSMMAAAGFLVQEKFHPIFPDVDGPAAFQLDQIPVPEQALLLLLPIFQSEIARAKKGWMEPDYSSDAAAQGSIRTLRKDYMPGDLGFDPLGLKPTSPAEFKEMQNKELNNGRLAMIAVAGMVGQELATGSVL
ncbi:serine threonine-protein kinase 3 [Chrysochromulina tobinii]|uniref:non-specific serine/threonine protein kinase n=1 Tax=Chrysochromulina tobinii TaxID=1460289 RepID=A0A0M0K2Z7_9EUKA|nr:serine threonine-protein kinase 3 [Chrysochromulina tobinii]|eukprot:KOO32942.1 serine threonine-protein kinase 3 [Chrysochromulina sp. CCMP291]